MVSPTKPISPLCALRLLFVEALHDLCDFWITLNEPNVYAVEAICSRLSTGGTGSLAYIPGSAQHVAGARRSLLRYKTLATACTDWLLLALSSLRSCPPLLLARSYCCGLAGEPLQLGTIGAAEGGRFTFPANMLAAPLARAAGTRDYHGINYYTREMVRFDPDLPGEMFGRRLIRSGAIINDPGLDGNFGEIYPAGLLRVLTQVYNRTRGNKPLYITENGFNDARDDRRPRAILEHLAMVHRAIRSGIPVRGYSTGRWWTTSSGITVGAHTLG